MQKMSRSNVKAKRWMINNGYKNIFLFPHTRWSKDAHIISGDISAEFDGIATRENNIVFFQIKSNCRATKKMLRDYKTLEAVFGIECLWINAVDRQKGIEINNEKRY